MGSRARCRDRKQSAALARLQLRGLGVLDKHQLAPTGRTQQGRDSSSVICKEAKSLVFLLLNLQMEDLQLAPVSQGAERRQLAELLMVALSIPPPPSTSSLELLCTISASFDLTCNAWKLVLVFIT